MKAIAHQLKLLLGVSSRGPRLDRDVQAEIDQEVREYEQFGDMVHELRNRVNAIQGNQTGTTAALEAMIAEYRTAIDRQGEAIMRLGEQLDALSERVAQQDWRERR